ncbi:unnamed protein product [Knipowitschia caucasica]
MVVSCWVNGCSNRAGGSVKLGFYSIPIIRLHECEKTKLLSEQRRRLWLAKINRQETPSKHARICSEHFVSGKPSDLFDQNNPDWAPSLKLAGCLTPRKSESNLKKATGSTNRFIRAKKRKASKAKHAAASPLLELHATTVSDIEVENVADVAAGPNCSFRKLGKMDPPTCKPKRADHLKTFTPDAQGPSDASQHDRIKTELRLESPESAHLFEENVTQSDHWLQLHTGLPSLDMFSFLLSYVNGVLPTSTVMSCKSILLCVLVKLRLNLKYQDLAQCFRVSLTTVSDILNLYLPILAQKLCFLIQWPEKDDLIRHMPSVFKALYPKCCGIIDCFKVYIQRPEHLPDRAQTNYNHNTIKFLVSITPTGAISFVSKVFSGRTSDGVMTRLSGFLDKLQSGDQVMSNQSFLITEELANHGATLIIPAFSPEPLSSSDVDQIRVRIQVEKAIERLKSFRILSTSMSLHMVPHADSIVTLCSALSNLQPTLVA